MFRRNPVCSRSVFPAAGSALHNTFTPIQLRGALLSCDGRHFRAALQRVLNSWGSVFRSRRGPRRPHRARLLEKRQGAIQFSRRGVFVYRWGMASEFDRVIGLPLEPAKFDFPTASVNPVDKAQCMRCRMRRSRFCALMRTSTWLSPTQPGWGDTIIDFIVRWVQITGNQAQYHR